MPRGQAPYIPESRQPVTPPPANTNRPPIRVVPPPAVDTNDHSALSPKISFGVLTKFFGSFAGALLTPSPAGDGSTISEQAQTYPELLQSEGFQDAPEEVKRMAVGAIAETIPDYELPTYDQPPIYRRPEIPEIPWQEFTPEVGPAFTRSPKRGDLIINVPEFEIPSPIKVDPDPSHDIWNVPDDVPIEELYPESIPQPDPSIAPEVFTSPQSKVSEAGVVIEVVSDNGIQVRVRPTRQRASVRRRKDTKANRRMLKAAHKLVNVTYGSYSEVMDFLEALAWNVYEVRGGKRVLVMSTNGGSVFQTLDGLAKGRYEVDLASLIVDYAFMQAQDFVIGRMGQLATESAINNLGWTSPQGPSGFANAINIL